MSVVSKNTLINRGQQVSRFNLIISQFPELPGIHIGVETTHYGMKTAYAIFGPEPWVAHYIQRGFNNIPRDRYFEEQGFCDTLEEAIRKHKWEYFAMCGMYIGCF